MKSFLPVVVLIFACIGFCSANRCYACTSLSSSGCGDPFEKDGQQKYLQDCGAGENYCIKVQKDDLVERVCGNGVCGSSQCEEVNGGHLCCCSGDGCNSATTRRISYVAMVAMVILTKLAAF